MTFYLRTISILIINEIFNKCRSWEWNALSERDRDLLASRSQHEGEFW